MKVLFVITNSEMGTWLSEVTHPYWHLAERDVEIDFASPRGGKISWTPRSDPYFEHSLEPQDLVSRGFLAKEDLVSRLHSTLVLRDVDLEMYDAIHVAGGRGATFDLYPNEDVALALEYFWLHGKTVGAICHGSVALGNIPACIEGRSATAFSLEEDRELERQFGSGFVIPHYPQIVLEQAGAQYKSAAPHEVCVIVDGNLVTGQNQQSASEYGIALYHTITGTNPVLIAA